MIPVRKWRGALDEDERGDWNSWLKSQRSKNKDHGIQSHHFMANRRGEAKAVTDFIFLGSKITADSDFSHEIKRCLLIGRKAMTNLNSMLKSKHITLPAKALYSQSCGFSHVWMWELDHKGGWATKFDAFELCCWRRHLKVLWTARSNQSTLKEIYPKYFWRTDVETKAALLWPSDVKSQLIGKEPDAGKI